MARFFRNLCILPADFQPILSCFLADFRQISADSEAIHIRFSANSQPIFNQYSADSEQILSRFLTDSHMYDYQQLQSVLGFVKFQQSSRPWIHIFQLNHLMNSRPIINLLNNKTIGTHTFSKLHFLAKIASFFQISTAIRLSQNYSIDKNS